MEDELIDILTPKGEFLGVTALKSIAHKEGLWHASVQIWLYTPGGEVLIQKRAACKDTYPNLWDISVAGHLSAGDTPITASIREIEEEVGISISIEELQFLKTIKKSKKPNIKMLDNEFNHLFLCCIPIALNKLELQTEEVAAVKLTSITTLRNALQNTSEDFVPHGAKYYHYILQSISSALNAK